MQYILYIIYVIKDQKHDWLTDWPEKQINYINQCIHTNAVNGCKLIINKLDKICICVRIYNIPICMYRIQHQNRRIIQYIVHTRSRQYSFRLSELQYSMYFSGLAWPSGSPCEEHHLRRPTHQTPANWLMQSALDCTLPVSEGCWPTACNRSPKAHWSSPWSCSSLMVDTRKEWKPNCQETNGSWVGSVCHLNMELLFAKRQATLTRTVSTSCLRTKPPSHLW